MEGLCQKKINGRLNAGWLFSTYKKAEDTMLAWGFRRDDVVIVKVHRKGR